ncbi:MAG: NUDIX domain-containing protein [Acetatifactor sp.]|nr:NUDIX domain-containing protein [Acetatifactor sp.]
MEGKLRNMVALYLMTGDKLLLLYRIGSRVLAKPVWCGIGGHFEREELNDARAALLREVEEEIGLQERDLEDLRLRYVTLRQKDGEIRLNYYFFARLTEDAAVSETCDEGILEWVPLEQVCDRDMPYTAGYVVRHYLETGRWEEALYCGIAGRQGVQFVKLEEF